MLFNQPGLGPGGVGDETAKRIKPEVECVLSAGHGGKGGVRSASIKDYAGQVYGREGHHTFGGSGGNNCIIKLKKFSQYQCFARPCSYLHLAAQLF